MKRRLMRSKATRWLSYLLGLRNVCGLLLRLLIGNAVITVFYIMWGGDLFCTVVVIRPDSNAEVPGSKL